MPVKKCLFLWRHAHMDDSLGQEMLEAAIMNAAFGQETHVAFIDDGVFRLTAPSLSKNAGGLFNAWETLSDYDIDCVWAEEESLAQRGLSSLMLKIPATLLSRQQLTEKMAEMDIIVPI